MSRPSALVTGGCGFVGRHFVQKLLHLDYQVTLVDDLSAGIPVERWLAPVNRKEDRRSRLAVYYRDFREYASQTTADFDLIVHLAAVVGGRLTIDGDPLKVATDLAIDATFFNWVVKHRPLPRKVMFFSSSAAYPIAEQTQHHHRTLSERLIDFDGYLGVPDMTYGWAKLTGEFLARHAVETYGLDVVIYRPFSGYGEDQDFTYPFPSIVRRVACGESPIVIWGSGKQLRDFIHIDDVVEAVFASAWEMQPGNVLNLGSGCGTSFVELAQRACRVIGHEADIVNDTTKPEGVFARIGDCRKMFEYYKPRVDLDEGIARAFAYQLAGGFVSPRKPAAADALVTTAEWMFGNRSREGQQP
jgi:nucleoside-diphosphate-sugar epimerase